MVWNLKEVGPAERAPPLKGLFSEEIRAACSCSVFLVGSKKESHSKMKVGLWQQGAPLPTMA